MVVVHVGIFAVGVGIAGIGADAEDAGEEGADGRDGDGDDTDILLDAGLVLGVVCEVPRLGTAAKDGKRKERGNVI